MKQMLTPQIMKNYRQRTAERLGQKQNQATKIRMESARSSAQGLMAKAQQTEAEMTSPKKEEDRTSSVVASLEGWFSSVIEREPFDPPKKESSSQPVSSKETKGLPLREGNIDFSGVENVEQLVMKSEGLRLKAYDDIKQTSIGYGSKGKPGEVITEEEALRRLREDLKSAREVVMRANENHGYEWSSNQIDALTSFVHNLGATNFTRLIDKGNRGNEEIIEYLPQYNKAKGKNGKLVELRGLTERRNQELKIFEQGY